MRIGRGIIKCRSVRAWSGVEVHVAFRRRSEMTRHNNEAGEEGKVCSHVLQTCHT